MKYSTILFDLDGTLTESGIGITRSVAYACEKLGLPVPEQAILDRFVGPSVYFDYAYFTMLSQFGSTVLIVMVGEYGSKEDVEVASNAFVLNVLVGIVLYILFVGAVSL